MSLDGAPPRLLLDLIGAGFHRVGVGLRERWIVLAPAIHGDAVYAENLFDTGPRVPMLSRSRASDLRRAVAGGGYYYIAGIGHDMR